MVVSYWHLESEHQTPKDEETSTEKYRSTSQIYSDPIRSTTHEKTCGRLPE
jgi:hypothetical protein